MLGTSLNLSIARILHHSQKDDVDFSVVKLEAMKHDFSEAIRRFGDFNLYKSCKQKIENIQTSEQLLEEISKLKFTLKERGVDLTSIDLYSSFVKKCLSASKESCKKTYTELQDNFDIITNNKQSMMFSSVQKFDDNGNVVPLFQKDEHGGIESFTDKQGVQRYKLNDAVIDWSEANKFYQFIKLNNFKVHGHTILWHVAEPYQIKELAKSDLSPEIKNKMAQDFLYGYMQSFYQNIKDNGIQMESIDILNEIANDEQSEDFLRKSSWRDLMGDTYYIDVLKMAKQIFPSEVKLMYNDFNEFIPEKRKNILKVIDSIKKVENEEGIQLVDAIGLQCHLYGQALDYEKAFDEISNITKTGLFQQEVRITELDSAPCNNPEWQQGQMKQVLQVAKSHGVTNIGCWNATEQFSDSIDNSKNSGLIDINGNKSQLANKVIDVYSDKGKDSSLRRE